MNKLSRQIKSTFYKPVRILKQLKDNNFPLWPVVAFKLGEQYYLLDKLKIDNKEEIIDSLDKANITIEECIDYYQPDLFMPTELKEAVDYLIEHKAFQTIEDIVNFMYSFEGDTIFYTDYLKWKVDIEKLQKYKKVIYKHASYEDSIFFYLLEKGI